MKTKMNMIYWKGEKFWLGKFLEHPEIMTQGETIAELEENLKDAYLITQPWAILNGRNLKANDVL